jgi:hypothetical protein
MAEKEKLLLALEMITEGTEARVPEGFRAEAANVRAATTPWTSVPGVQGFGIAEKITDREQLDEVVLKVYVDKKRPKSQLSDPVPKTVRIPGWEEPVATDVEEIGALRPQPNTIRLRPAVPGFGVGHLQITVGTLGCLVQKKGNKKALYILSNSHVLANEGLAAAGDPIVQPGRDDGGEPSEDAIAELAEWVPFQFTADGFPNLVDAAIARVKSAKSVTSAIRIIGVPKGISTTVRRGMRVQKTGRTTDYTQGVIKDINFRPQLRYKKSGGGKGRVGFREQVLCTRYTDGGDSGSAVLNMQGKVVGLHFAGSASGSVFNRIRNVLDALDIEIVTHKM